MTDKTWIQVFSGGKFWPLEPERGEIRIDDIARALSMLCRYNGHVSRFYSVAEHSVHVSRIVESRERARCCARGGGRLCRRVRHAVRWGLLHDASEAYLADVPRPVKHLPEMAPYREMERKLQRQIVLWFGLNADEPQLVKEIDTEILGTEARLLKSPVHPDWALTTATGKLPPALDLGPMGWAPAEAERQFLKRYHELGNQ